MARLPRCLPPASWKPTGGPVTLLARAWRGLDVNLSPGPGTSHFAAGVVSISDTNF